MPKNTKEEIIGKQDTKSDSSKYKKSKKDKETKEDWKCRLAEYYGMQAAYDDFCRRSAANEDFTDLIPVFFEDRVFCSHIEPQKQNAVVRRKE